MNERNDRIYAVVVTYNRLCLLKKTVEALLGQTARPDKIFIVDNASTDDTPAYLESLAVDSLFRVIRLDTNTGGAGGFSAGIKAAVKDGCDWVWLMDDDTEPSPAALENLIRCKDLDAKVGYLASRVVWRDGSQHLMNVPWVRQDVFVDGRLYPFDKFGDERAFTINCASFVSFMIRSEVVGEIGLPYKDFFIWLDDFEYSMRIKSHGYFGLYVYDSVAVHNTERNEAATLVTAAPSQAWKFFYEVRNRMFLERFNHKSYFSFVKHSFKQYRKYLKQVDQRADAKDEYRQNIKRGFRAGLKFRPHIEFV